MHIAYVLNKSTCLSLPLSLYLHIYIYVYILGSAGSHFGGTSLEIESRTAIRVLDLAFRGLGPKDFNPAFLRQVAGGLEFDIQLQTYSNKLQICRDNAKRDAPMLVYVFQHPRRPGKCELKGYP